LKRHVLSALAGTVAIVAFGVAGCGPETSPSGLTHAQAVAMAQAFYQKEATALHTWDVTQEDKLEAPPESIIDAAGIKMNKLTNQRPPALPGKKDKGPSVKAYVAKNADVFAVYEGGSDPLYMLFKKQGSTWKLVHSPNILPDVSTLPKIEVDKSGYATVLTAANQTSELKVTADAMAQRYVKDLNAAASKSFKGDSTFASGVATNSIWSQIPKLSTSTLKVSLKASPSSYQSTTFALSGGGGLAFVTVRYDLVGRETKPGVLVQDQKRSKLASLIPPGKYQRVTTEYLVLLAAKIPAQGAKGAVQVVGFYNGVIGFSTTAE